MLTPLTAYEATEDRQRPGFLLLSCCLLICLFQEEIAHWSSTGMERSTSLLISGSLLISLVPTLASELLLFTIRRMQLIHVFKSQFHGKLIPWKQSDMFWECHWWTKILFFFPYFKQWVVLTTLGNVKCFLPLSWFTLFACQHICPLQVQISLAIQEMLSSGNQRQIYSQFTFCL